MKWANSIPTIALTLLLSVPANATLHTGEVRLYIGESWDFSDSSGGIWPTADISYAVVIEKSAVVQAPASDRVFTFPPALITFISDVDSTYEKLETAPTDMGVYANGLWPLWDDVLVVKTREGHYAKLQVLVPDGALLRFRYTYQDDGTPSFTTPVSVRASTWGKIKSLYR
jgi:hypothetical protein